MIAGTAQFGAVGAMVKDGTVEVVMLHGSPKNGDPAFAPPGPPSPPSDVQGRVDYPKHLPLLGSLCQ